MNNPEFVEVGCTGHDLRELKVIRDCKNGVTRKKRIGAPTASGSLLDWT